MKVKQFNKNRENTNNLDKIINSRFEFRNYEILDLIEESKNEK
jgi:hypothetical protein